MAGYGTMEYEAWEELQKNELAALAMTGSDEPRHDSVSSFTLGKSSRLFMRIWYAKDDFFSTIMFNTIGGKARIDVVHGEYPGGNRPSKDVKHSLKVPIEIYLSLFANNNNYHAICELEGDKLEEAFALCGNDPSTAEQWYDKIGARSLSVGDIVEVVRGDKSTFYACAPYGYKILPHNDLDTYPVQEYSFKKGNRLFSGSLGNGFTYCDRWNEEHGDYVKWAHYQPEDNAVTFYNCPDRYRDIILRDIRAYCASQQVTGEVTVNGH